MVLRPLADEGIGRHKVVGEEQLVKTMSVGVLCLREALVADSCAGDVARPSVRVEQDDADLVLLGGLGELLPVSGLLCFEGLRVWSVGDGKHVVEARGARADDEEPGVLLDDDELVRLEELFLAALAVGLAEKHVELAAVVVALIT